MKSVIDQGAQGAAVYLDVVPVHRGKRNISHHVHSGRVDGVGLRPEGHQIAARHPGELRRAGTSLPTSQEAVHLKHRTAPDGHAANIRLQQSGVHPVQLRRFLVSLLGVHGPVRIACRTVRTEQIRERAENDPPHKVFRNIEHGG